MILAALSLSDAIYDWSWRLFGPFSLGWLLSLYNMFVGGLFVNTLDVFLDYIYVKIQ